MLKIDLGKILAEFGNALGLELAFDDKGVCGLTLDEETPIIIQSTEEDSSLTLSSMLRSALPDPLGINQVENLFALALDPMVRGGASPVAGRDPESGNLVLYMVLTPSVLDKTPLAELFEAFVATRDAVAAMLDEPVEAPLQFGDQFSKLWV